MRDSKQSFETVFHLDEADKEQMYKKMQLFKNSISSLKQLTQEGEVSLQNGTVQVGTPDYQEVAAIVQAKKKELEVLERELQQLERNVYGLG